MDRGAYGCGPHKTACHHFIEMFVEVIIIEKRDCGFKISTVKRNGEKVNYACLHIYMSGLPPAV
jgi:hypothetical protein